MVIKINITSRACYVSNAGTQVTRWDWPQSTTWSPGPVGGYNLHKNMKLRYIFAIRTMFCNFFQDRIQL